MGYVGEIFSLVADAAFLAILHSWYKKVNHSAYQIKKAQKITLDENLRSKLKSSGSQCVEYACVEGEVKPVRHSLHSRHMEDHIGVIQSILIEEHKSKRIQGFWTDVKNIIQDTVQSVPFVLHQSLDNGLSARITVMEPLEAEFITDDLTTTYDHFEPTNAGWMSRGMDRIFGEVTKGHHETERMLLTNTMMLGIGKVTLVDDKFQLKSPGSGRKFVLTTMSKEEVIKRLENRSFWLRVVMATVGVAGVILMIRLVVKIYRKRRSEREREAIRIQAQELREQVAEARRLAQDGVDAAYDRDQPRDDNDQGTCVVCLVNRREICLLNCGHICLCADCLTLLPEPLMCPVCREPVQRYITTYMP